MTAQALETLRLLDGAVHVEADEVVAAVAGELAEALALRPQHDGDGGRAVDGGDVVRRLAVQPQDAEAVVLQFRHGAGRGW